MIIGGPKCWRCSNCGISYPQNFMKCQVCEGKLDVIQDKPDTDWKEKVALMTAPEPVENDDRVFLMRLRRLFVAGMFWDDAEKVAADRTIDLHDAERLVAQAGPDLASKILL